MERLILILAISQTILGQSNDIPYRLGKSLPMDKNSQLLWIQELGGVPMDKLKETRLHPAVNIYDDDFILPKKFDARQKWPQCASLNIIRTQGCCGSCWAVSAASVMTDRWCIHSKGKEHFHFGAYDLISCCDGCGAGCGPGLPGPTWMYWVKRGVSSGGPYNSNQGCHSYPMPAECPSNHERLEAPDCSDMCQQGYNVTESWKDRRYGRVAYSVPANEGKIMEEIYINGPVQAVMEVYADLVDYTDGVYRHKTGGLKNGHGVKLIGWGVEDGTKYWLVANSWGVDRGDDGFFKIVRGENHCKIEENVHAGLPSYLVRV
ncbi:cathepsin B-like [Ochlerotatus camptorhynchus]|uniref:cathepsin B-like n=1 Tax=Ochlerotatus camptorhynchus TaxID=644619 RepID=UPI0031DBF112